MAKILQLLALAGFLGVAVAMITVVTHTNVDQLSFVITVTENGFVPSTTTITAGQTIIFKSDVTRPFWPAADAHPTHGLYPEFDPLKPIAPDEQWSFTFDNLGTWTFHDHLVPQHTGTIHVQSEYGGATQACLTQSELENLTMQNHCWEEEFKNQFKAEGLSAVIDTFEQYQENSPVFQRNCHDVMHIIGDIAYDDYKRTGLPPEDGRTSLCGYGFYHGFIERILAEDGGYNRSAYVCEQVANLQSFASQTLADDAEYACQHGVGHAVLDSQENANNTSAEDLTANSIAVCESIFTTSKAQYQCVTGVFNALAIAYTKNYYGFTFGDEPFHICEIQPAIYKDACYIDISTYYFASSNIESDQIFTYLEKIPSLHRLVAIEALSADIVQWRLSTLADEQALMQSCFTQYNNEERASCLRGIHLGVLKKNSPWTNVEKSKTVCSTLETQAEIQECESFIYRKLE